MNNLGELIRLSKIKQDYLARKLNVSQATVSFWKSGKKTPTVDNAIALADILGVTVGCIVGTENIPDGYPDAYIIPTTYHEVMEDQKKAEEEGRIPKMKKAPFTEAQMEYLESREDQLVDKIVGALREDTSWLKDAK